MNAFQPSGNLVLPAQGPDSVRFVLASQAWLDLQSRLQAVLNLPSDMTEYAGRYGDPSSGILMKECFDALRHLRQAAQRYGSPASLREMILRDPGLLGRAQRPDGNAFAATAWTMERVHGDAFMLSSALRSIPGIVQQESTANACAGIKSLFVDHGQILDSMSLTVDLLDRLIAEFECMQDALAQAQEQMRTYTERSSKTRMELDRELGALAARIAQLERHRNDAYAKWLALAISACALPAVIGVLGIGIMVLLAVPTGGTSFAVGSAVTGAASALAAAALGVAASNARTTYDAIVADLHQRSTQYAKRCAYGSDLAALDNMMRFTLPSSNDVIGQLRLVRAEWNGSARELAARVSELTPRNLHNSRWAHTEEMQAASSDWTRLDDALKAFMTGAFVDAQLLDFGASLPQDEPSWQKHFMQKRAA